jgi:integrase
MAARLDGTDLKRIMEALGRVEKAVGMEARAMKTWIYLRKSVYYVGWYDPEGHRRRKSCGPGGGGKRTASKLAEKINAELVTGLYNVNSGKTWDAFRAEYEQHASSKSAATRKEIRLAFNAFARVVKPVKMASIKAAMIDRFARVRLAEESPTHPGQTLSPATANKELRHLKAALKKARKWGYIQEVPEIEMLSEPHKLPRYIPPKEFSLLYGAAGQANLPKGQTGYSAGDWWQAVLIFAYMTGWRVGQIMALRREDVDLENGVATARADVAGNKAKRERRTPMHSVVIDHLRKLVGFSDHYFLWPHDPRSLYRELHRLCEIACLPRYGFHDFRRGFATVNADRMSQDALQEWMQHSSAETTRRYVAVARQMRPALGAVFVPDLKRLAE